MIGQTLSHYRITAAIGAGGMGEVFRATDTTLGRDLAIKLLPAELAQDKERSARFEREAKLLASLIWAFGVVLNETLTGQRLFQGETVTDVLAAVVRQEIAWEQLPASTPARVRRLLARCLQRDPRQRLRDIGDARIALGAVEEEGPAGPTAARSGGRPRPRGFWFALVAAGLLGGIGIGTLLPWRSSTRGRTPSPRVGPPATAPRRSPAHCANLKYRLGAAHGLTGAFMSAWISAAARARL